MNPKVEAEVLAEMERARTHPPEPGPAELRGDVYADPEVVARERDGVFRRSWVPLVREEDIQQPGDFHTLELGGVPLVAVRTGAGEVAVLHNVCRHRGAQIVREPRGNAQQLRCAYHGFTYDLGGTLAGQPQGETFCPDAQVGRLALPRAASGLFGGWVWACLDPAGQGLGDYLGEELQDELRNWPLDDCRPVDARESLEAFDWKIGVEAFLEPFHVPSIHPRTAHPLVDMRGMATRELGDHSRMALPFRSPGAYSSSGIFGSAAEAAGVPVFDGLNQAQRQAHFVYLVFPSTIWMLLPNHLLALRFLPAGLGQCRMRYELLAAPPGSPAAAAWLASLRPGYDALLREDVENLPWIQKGAGSGSLGSMPLSGYERRIEGFRRALGRYTA